MEDHKDNDITIDVCLQNAKSYFATGVSKPLSYRRDQLKKLAKGCREMQSEILLALKLDLRRSDYLSKILEFDHLLFEINNVRNNL